MDVTSSVSGLLVSTAEADDPSTTPPEHIHKIIVREI
jgi:hypothetical protein